MTPHLPACPPPPPPQTHLHASPLVTRPLPGNLVPLSGRLVAMPTKRTHAEFFFFFFPVYSSFFSFAPTAPPLARGALGKGRKCFAELPALISGLLLRTRLPTFKPCPLTGGHLAPITGPTGSNGSKRWNGYREEGGFNRATTRAEFLHESQPIAAFSPRGGREHF